MSEERILGAGPNCMHSVEEKQASSSVVKYCKKTYHAEIVVLKG